ncbi:MAG: glycoside hydrolase family 38 C-terminal domain-containing protein [Calditrichia bacterium]
MPQFYLNAGIDAFITQKIGWNDTSVFPYRVFWWEGPDGSRILSYFPFDYVNEISDPYEMVDWLRQFEANTSFTKLLILFGVGDHGGGPSMAMLDHINRLRDLDIFPSIEFETASDYLDWLKSQDLSGLPVWDDELYLEYHRGTLTTQSNTKKMNRESEVLLTNAEKFSALAALYNHPYPAADLEAAWKKVLFNQFHDILPGSSIREVYIDAAEDYQKSTEIGQHTLTNALNTISSRINTSDIKKGKPVVVFNSLSQKRDGIVTVKLEEGDNGSYRIYDASGKEVPSQILTAGKYDRSLIFRAENVPPIGYTVYDMRAGESGKKAPDLAVTGNSLENKYFKVTLDPQTGWLSSIWDKQKNREILSGAGNELQLFEDRPSAWDAWNIGLKQRYHSKFRRIELLETGPVRCVLRVYHDFLNPHTQKMYPTEDFPSSFFTQDIILYSQTPRVDFKTKVDWWEDHTMLKVAFPVAVEDSLATYEIPYGSIRRQTHPVKDTEKGKWEVAGLRWADLSSGNYGVSLLNKTKYGYDIKDNVMRLSLLRSPTWPDPTADRGKHTIEYAIYPHSGDCAEGQTTLQGYEYNYPLLAVTGEGHGGKLPLTKSFVSLEPENLMLTTIKQVEDGSRAWIIQWYETRGEDSRGVLELPFKPKKVVNSNFLEEDLAPVASIGNRIMVMTPGHKIKTVKVYF